MRLTIPCGVCLKPLESIKTFKLGDKILTLYRCGHIFAKEKEESKTLVLTSVNGDKKAREYQAEGVDFIVNPPDGNEPFNAIIGDQQRLGKTPQSLLALASDYKNRTPCLIIVRAANLWQWIREYKTWADPLPMGIFPIIGTQSFIPEGFSAYVISMDTFSRKGMVSRLLQLGIRLVIADECHSFKNTDSNRSQALVAFLKQIHQTEIVKIISFFCTNCDHIWKETITVKENVQTKTSSHRAYCPKCNAMNTHTAHNEKTDTGKKCGLILLSGTAIKNRADEMFVPLNLVAPEKFPSLEALRRKWLVQNSRGQYTRVNPFLYDQFKREIAPFFLRREKEDVYKDLPPLNRMFTVMKVEDEALKKLYNKTLDRIEQNLERANFKLFDSIGDLQILRQICGLAKVNWVVEQIDDAINNTDKQIKIAVGVHHHSVRDNVYNACIQYGALKLSGEDSPEKKDYIMRSFETDTNQVLSINSLAGGVGMDFHYCDYTYVLERQWSYADEEQFEYRFYNPDISIMGEGRSANIEYPICQGTIDEWFYDLVEEKRQIFGETLGTNWDINQDPDSFKKLLEKTVQGRL